MNSNTEIENSISFQKNEEYKNNDEINQDDDLDLMNSIRNIIQTTPYDFLVKDLNILYNEESEKRLNKNNNFIFNKDSFDNNINKDYNNKIDITSDINQNIINNNINENISDNVNKKLNDGKKYDINSIERKIENYKSITENNIIDGVVDNILKSNNNSFFNCVKNGNILNNENKESAPSIILETKKNKNIINKNNSYKKDYISSNNNQNNNLNKIKNILETSTTKKSSTERGIKFEIEEGEESKCCLII